MLNFCFIEKRIIKFIIIAYLLQKHTYADLDSLYAEPKWRSANWV